MSATFPQNTTKPAYLLKFVFHVIFFTISTDSYGSSLPENKSAVLAFNMTDVNLSIVFR